MIKDYKVLLLALRLSLKITHHRITVNTAFLKMTQVLVRTGSSVYGGFVHYHQNVSNTMSFPWRADDKLWYVCTVGHLSARRPACCSQLNNAGDSAHGTASERSPIQKARSVGASDGPGIPGLEH